MTLHRFALLFVAFATFALNSPAQAQPAQDVEVLGHGPIHEAFAQPATAVLASNVVVQKQPPAPVEELPPDVKPEGDHVVWIPGYWAFDNERNDFVWVSGFWRNVPPGRVWVSGYWVNDTDGFRWVAGFWSAPAETQYYYPPPPEPVAEAPPAAPDNTSFYVAGIWVYRDGRYMWRPGYWSAFRPGWLWVEPHYVWTPGGYLYIDGYWDYDLDRRGVLFAPVAFTPQYLATTRVYRPMYAIATDLLFASLFVRPSAGFYYFGDYYAPRYATLGYTPWLDYRYRGRYADPMWSYYAWRHRSSPRWEQDVRASYTARQNGAAAVPPRRFSAQPQGNLNVTQNTSVVVPLQQLQTRQNIKMQNVTRNELTSIKQHTEQSLSLRKERQNLEQRIDAKATRQQPVEAKFPLHKAIVGTSSASQPPPPLHPRVDPNVNAVHQPPAEPRSPAQPDPRPKQPNPGGEVRPQPTPVTPRPQVNPQQPGNPLQPAPEPKHQPMPPNPTPPHVAPPKVNPPVQPLQPTPRPTPQTVPQPHPTPAPQPVPHPMPPAAQPRPMPAVQHPAPPAVQPPAPHVTPQPAPRPQPAPQVAPHPQPAPQPAPRPQAAPQPAPHPAPPAPTPRVTAPPPHPQPPAAPKEKGKDKGKD